MRHYLETAAHNNPAVKAAFHAYEASLQQVAQASAYEDPKLDFGLFLEPMDMMGGRQLAQFQLMQMFPWFGTRKAARTEMMHMAEMNYEEFREARDNLYLQVYTQWYLLCNLQQKKSNTGENLKLLQQLEQLALQKFSSGQTGNSSATNRQSSVSSQQAASGGMNMGGMNMGEQGNANTSGNSMEGMEMGGMKMGGSSPGMSEILRIHIEMAELESNLESLFSEISAAKARFNALLNRPATHEVVIPDTIIPVPFQADPSLLIPQITTRNPMLGMLAEEAQTYEARTKMERKMSYPMFGIGVQYMLMGKSKESTMAMDQGGKDMYMPMFSISLPVFRKKYKSAIRESELMRLSSEQKYTNAHNSLQAEMLQAIHLLQDAGRKITLYRKQAGLARVSHDLAVKEFVSGKSNLSDIIQVVRQLLDYELKEAEACADYNTKVAVIQKIASQFTPEEEEQ